MAHLGSSSIHIDASNFELGSDGGAVNLVLSGGFGVTPIKIHLSSDEEETPVSPVSSYYELFAGRALGAGGPPFWFHMVKVSSGLFPGQIVHFRSMVPASGNAYMTLVGISGNFYAGNIPVMPGAGAGMGDPTAASCTIVWSSLGKWHILGHNANVAAWPAGGADPPP